MNVQIEFKDNTTVIITSDNGEVFAAHLFIPPWNEKERQSLIQSLTRLFEISDNLGEVENRASVMLFDRVSYGIQFSYVVTPSEAKRKALGAAIRQMRESKGYSARQFAFLIQMDPSNYARIESGKHSLSIDTLNKIAFYLDAEVKLVPKENSTNTDKSNCFFRYE